MRWSFAPALAIVASLSTSSVALAASSTASKAPARATFAMAAPAVLNRPAITPALLGVLASSPSEAVVAVQTWDGRRRLDRVGADGAVTALSTDRCERVLGLVDHVFACFTPTIDELLTIDLTTGATAHHTASQQSVLAWAGHGWYETGASQGVSYRPLGGVPTVLNGSVRVWPVRGSVGDERGVAVIGQTSGNVQPTVYYLSRSTGALTTLAGTPTTTPLSLALASGRLWICDSWPPTSAKPSLVSSVARDADGTPLLPSRTAPVSGSFLHGVATDDRLLDWSATTLRSFPADSSQPVSILASRPSQSLLWPSVGVLGGSVILTTDDGTSSQVQTVGPQGRHRFADINPGFARATRLSVDQGQLYAAFQGSVGTGQHRDLVRYALPAVPGAGAPTTVRADTGAAGDVQRSGGWTLATGGGGRPVLTSPTGAATTLSGEALAFSAGWVVTAAGVRSPAGVTTSLGSGVVAAALHASSVAWLTKADGILHWRDLSTPTVAARTVATLPATSRCAQCASLALDGRRLVLRSVAGTRLFDIALNTSRTLPVVPACTSCAVPAASHGVLAWSDPAGVRVLDLTTAAATPLVLDAEPALAGVTVAEGRVAWIGADGSPRWTNAPAVAGPGSLLFAQPTAWGFSPNADKHYDTWAVDGLVAPGTQLRLDLRTASGAIVRTLRASAIGPARLLWDGRNAKGAGVADGRYTWTVSGSDAAGKVLVTPVGAMSYTGTVVLQRVAPSTVLSVPEVAATSTAYTDRVTATWRAVSNPTGHVLRYDLRAQEAPGSRGFVSLGIAPVDLATSTLVRTSPFEPSTPERTLQFSVRARDALGNVGAWSPWRGSALAVDQSGSFVSRSAGWVRVANAHSYNGSVLRSSASGRSLSSQGYGRVVTVLATRCATCGKVRVSVGGRSVVVDTHAGVTQYRQVIARFVLPAGNHHVSLTTVATSGRPYTLVDGFGYLR